MVFHHRLPALLLLLIPFTALAGESQLDFSSPPPDQWQRFEPLKSLGLDLARFEFTGGLCQLSCEAPPAPAIALYGYAAAPRLGLFAPDPFADCASSVDLLEWQPTLDRATDVSFPSVMTRVSTPAGLGTAGGYAFSLEILPNENAEAILYRIVQENPIALYRTSAFRLDPARDFRLLLVSRGNTHTGRLFDLADPRTPLLEITATDSTHPTGRAGFTLISDRPNAIRASFDNFLAWDGSPPPMAIRPGLAPDTLELITDAHRSLGSTLEFIPELADPEAVWLPVTAPEFRFEGASLIEIFSTAPAYGRTGFFRRRGL